MRYVVKSKLYAIIIDTCHIANQYLIYDLILKSQHLLVLLYNVVLLLNVPVLYQLSSHHQVYIFIS